MVHDHNPKGCHAPTSETTQARGMTAHERAVKYVGSFKLRKLPARCIRAPMPPEHHAMDLGRSADDCALNPPL